MEKDQLGTEVGLGPGHTVLGGDSAARPPKGQSPQFSAHIKMPLGMEVGLGPGNFVLDGDPFPKFWPMFIVAKWLDGSSWHFAWR